jgi:hypothetical protein
MSRQIQVKQSSSTPMFWLVTGVMLASVALVATLGSGSLLSLSIPLVIAVVVGLLTFNAAALVTYRLEDDHLVVRHLWMTRKYVLAEHSLETVKVKSLLRAFAVGLDNYNYGWYLVNDERVLAIATHLSLEAEVVVVRDSAGKARLLITPENALFLHSSRASI